MSDTRQALLKRIEADGDRIVGFLQAFKTHTLSAFDYLSRPHDV